jgi:hypothetical protein
MVWSHLRQVAWPEGEYSMTKGLSFSSSESASLVAVQEHSAAESTEVVVATDSRWRDDHVDHPRVGSHDRHANAASLSDWACIQARYATYSSTKEKKINGNLLRSKRSTASTAATTPNTLSSIDNYLHSARWIKFHNRFPAGLHTKMVSDNTNA